MFETVDEAQSAYRRLREILHTIDTWNREHRQEAIQIMGDLTPPELEFAREYQVEWPTAIDWDMGWGSYDPNHPDQCTPQVQKLIDEAVIVVGSLVFTSDPAQTWMGKQPFMGLLERLGASTLGYDMSDNWWVHSDLTCTLTFTARDSATAESIRAALTAYLNGPLVAEDNPPPWNHDTENFRAALTQGGSLHPDAVRTLVDQWQDGYDMYARVTSKPDLLPQKRLERLALSRPIEIAVDGLHFRLKDPWFFHQRLGLAALIAYLEVNSCHDIRVRYDWVPRSEEGS